MTHNLSRRSFIGASLLALPGVAAIASFAPRFPMKETAFGLSVADSPSILDLFEARRNAAWMELVEKFEDGIWSSPSTNVFCLDNIAV